VAKPQSGKASAGKPNAGRSRPTKTQSAKPKAAANKRGSAPVGSPPQGGGRRWLRGMFKVTLVAAAALLVYGIYLDGLVRQKMEGHTWNLPAQVYARPLELYPDQSLTRDKLVQELTMLNYRKVGTPQRPGEYSLSSSRVEVYRRPFDFVDGPEAAIKVLISFDGDRVARLQVSDSSRQLGFFRIEPMLVDRIQTSDHEDRTLTRLDRTPELLVETLLLVEDRDFYHHDGIAPLSIGRALLANIRAGRTVQGGSTLTQQLAKNLFLSRDRTLWRKANEAAIALLLEYRYSKDQLLEAYLNEVYLGQNGSLGVHGFATAGQFYFGRPLTELSPAQLATLVGLVKGPSYYDPWRYPERSQQRRDLILRLLVEHNLISTDSYQASLAEPLKVLPRGYRSLTRSPAFLTLVRRELQQQFAVQPGELQGIKIFTSLDPLLQQAAQEAASLQLAQLEAGGGAKALQAALVVVDWRKGEVSGVVGGRDPQQQGFNRALDANRPIGSLIKPAVTLMALDQGYTLASVLKDQPISLKSDSGQVWRPENYDHQFRGQVMLVDALAHSYNIPMVNLGMAVGLDKVEQGLHRLGIDKPFAVYPSTLLGSLDLSPFEVAQMYQTIAASGYYQPLATIRAITSETGEVVYRRPPKADRHFSAAASYLTLYGMQQVVNEGTAKALAASFPRVALAGKTGTTDDLRDSWFVGLDNRYLTAVWIGRDDNQPAHLTGASGALRVYRELLRRVSPVSIVTPAPEGVKSVRFDPYSGLALRGGCAAGIALPAQAGQLTYAENCTKEAVTGWLQRFFKL